MGRLVTWFRRLIPQRQPGLSDIHHLHMHTPDFWPWSPVPIVAAFLKTALYSPHTPYFDLLTKWHADCSGFISEAVLRFLLIAVKNSLFNRACSASFFWFFRWMAVIGYFRKRSRPFRPLALLPLIVPTHGVSFIFPPSPGFCILSPEFCRLTTFNYGDVSILCLHLILPIPLVILIPPVIVVIWSAAAGNLLLSSYLPNSSNFIRGSPPSKSSHSFRLPQCNNLLIATRAGISTLAKQIHNVFPYCAFLLASYKAPGIQGQRLSGSFPRLYHQISVWYIISGPYFVALSLFSAASFAFLSNLCPTQRHHPSVMLLSARSLLFLGPFFVHGSASGSLSSLSSFPLLGKPCILQAMMRPHSLVWELFVLSV